jgi:hypothetical protein
LGPSKSEPVSIEWHWYYHLPNFAGWGLILVLLLLVKENRDLHAWTILIPFLLLSEILWPWMDRLFSLSSPSMEHYGASLQWLLVGWTAIWLLGPWLARVRPLLNFALAVMLAALIGVAAQFGSYGNAYLNMQLLDYAVWMFALLVAMVFSAACCRKKYSPRRFLAWLVPWMVVGVTVGIACEFAWLLLPRYLAGGRPPDLSLLSRLVIACLCEAGILYVLNLPFMILAFRVPTYRERFRRVLRLPLPPDASPAAVPFDAIAEGSG